MIPFIFSTPEEEKKKYIYIYRKLVIDYRGWEVGRNGK
jgi:hypothetical protein